MLCEGDESTPVGEEEEIDASDMDGLHYLAVMPSLPTFLHVIFMVGRGMSFCQVSDMIRHERDVWSDVRR